ncbi:MAG: DUF1549 domain-containing protein [Planctomycetota bacterium]
MPVRTAPLLGLAAALSVSLTAGANETAFSDADVAFFEDSVKPILQDNCFNCHGAKPRIKSGLKLTSRAGALKGGAHGPAVDTANPAASLLLKMVNYTDDSHEMPPKGKLPQDQIDTLATWIEHGAPWTPGGVDFGVPTEEDHGGEVTEEAKRFWAFQPVTNPQAPAVQNKAWSTHPIDAFVFDRLQDNDLTPNAPASRESLIRRATYDLTGLPPTPRQVRDFVNDNTPGAYEKLIDRLLASPRYGEKWGRHWLDLVRFAETDSYERDNPKPNAWRYRDYVIDSFNTDKPYDRFITEQLAGDELPNPTHEQLIATGFYRLGLWDDEPVDADQAYYDYMDDLVTTTANTMLGLTLNCGRCHDHKIDPMPQSDYYRFMAFFHNIYNNIEQKQYTRSTPTCTSKISKTRVRPSAPTSNKSPPPSRPPRWKTPPTGAPRRGLSRKKPERFSAKNTTPGTRPCSSTRKRSAKTCPSCRTSSPSKRTAPPRRTPTSSSAAALTPRATRSNPVSRRCSASPIRSSPRPRPTPKLLAAAPCWPTGSPAPRTR